MKTPLARERHLEARLDKTKKQKELFEREKEIREIKKSMRRWQSPTTTKIIIAWLLINCTAVEIYSMVAMWHLQDLSALYSLIVAVVTETISFAVYAAKSYSETKQEELMKLEREKLASENKDFNPAEAAG